LKRSLFFLFIFLIFAMTAPAQTLGEYARQQREKKANTGSTVTYTNDSLRPPPAPPADASPATAPATTAAAPEAKPEAKGAAAETKPEAGQKPVRDEKYWRNLFAEARQDLARAENQVKVQQLRLNQAQKELLQRSDVYNKEQTIGDEIKEATAALEAAQKDVAQTKLKISTLEEDLRRSGSPAGWAR
jgi:hypothetical protein